MRAHPKTALLCGLALLLTMSPSNSRAGLIREDDTSCSQEQTTSLIKTFVRAFNRGDVDQLDRLWAQEPDFEWYLVDDEREQDAEDRRTLRLYFQERVLLNDHLKLRRLRVHRNGNDFAFKLLRTTDDERKSAAGLFHGKGAARESLAIPSLSQPIPAQTCLLIVWAMDTHTE